MNKLRLACFIGTAFEFFEFQIFAILLPYLTGYFFGFKKDADFIGYLAFAVAFLARPLGGLLLGHIGDHFGRRTALLTAMWMMALSTITLSLLPGYASWGLFAGIFLIFCRIVQGLSLGGEFSNGFVYLFEHLQSARCIDLIWLDLGGTIGLFISTVLVATMSLVFNAEAMQNYAWRLPFIAAFFLGLYGIYIRSALTQTQTHAELIQNNQARTLKKYYTQAIGEWRRLLLLILACAPGGIFWYLQVVFIPNQVLHLSALSLVPLIGLTLVCIPLGALLSDFVGLYRVWALSVVGLVLNFGLFVFSHSYTTQIFAMVLQAILLALYQGPRLLILTTSFPLQIRALNCSLVYSFANILGGLTPFVALSLFNRGELRNLYQLLLGIGCLSLVSMFLLKMQFAFNKDFLGEKKGVLWLVVRKALAPLQF